MKKIIDDATTMVGNKDWYHIKHNGPSLKELVDNGFSLKEIKDNGFSLKELIDNGFSPKELKGDMYLKNVFDRINDLRFNGQLKDVIAFCYNGFTLKELIDAGFSAEELKDVGVQCLEKHAGFPLTNRLGIYDIDMPLKKTLYNDLLLNSIVNLGFALQRITETDDISKIGVFLKNLKEKVGVSLKESAQVIRDFGFVLKYFGFSPKDLAYSGLSEDVIERLLKHQIQSPDDLLIDEDEFPQYPQYPPYKLRDHRFSLKELIDSGFSLQEIIDMDIPFKHISLTDMIAYHIPYNYHPYRLLDVSFAESFAELKHLNDSPSSNILRDTGLSYDEVIMKGFPLYELLSIVSLRELISDGLSFKKLKDYGFSIDKLKETGLSSEELKQAGATPNDFWKEARGYTVEEIFKLGYTYGDIRDIYKQYRDFIKKRYKSESRNPIHFKELNDLKTLFKKCKQPAGVFSRRRDINCTYTQTQSRKGGKKLNKRSRRRK